MPVTEKEGQWTEISRRTNEIPKSRGKQSRMMRIQEYGTSLLSYKKAASSSKSLAQVANQVASTPSIKKNKSEFSLIDSGTYCQVWYSRNNVSSKCRHLKQDTHFVRARTRNYESYFVMEDDHRRQTPNPAFSYSRNQPRLQRPPSPFNKHYNNKWCDMQYTHHHGPRSNRPYSDAPTDR